MKNWWFSKICPNFEPRFLRVLMETKYEYCILHRNMLLIKPHSHILSLPPNKKSVLSSGNILMCSREPLNSKQKDRTHFIFSLSIAWFSKSTHSCFNDERDKSSHIRDWICSRKPRNWEFGRYFNNWVYSFNDCSNFLWTLGSGALIKICFFKGWTATSDRCTSYTRTGNNKIQQIQWSTFLCNHRPQLSPSI